MKPMTVEPTALWGIGTAMLLALLAAPSTASAQGAVFNACYVPDVGAVYMIKIEGTPTACLAATHVEFSWTSGGELADGAVVTAKLADGAVTSAKLADAAATGMKVAADAITTAHIVDGAVGTVDMADGSVTQAKLAEGITATVADGSITTAKLADAAATGVKIAADAIGSTHIVDGAVATADLADGSVASAKIVAGAVGNEHLAAGVVTSDKIHTAVAHLSHWHRVELSGTVTLVAGQPTSRTATCPSGKVAVGGGGRAEYSFMSMYGSYGTDTSWTVYFRNTSGSSVTVTTYVIVYCAIAN